MVTNTFAVDTKRHIIGRSYILQPIIPAYRKAEIWLYNHLHTFIGVDIKHPMAQISDCRYFDDIDFGNDSLTVYFEDTSVKIDFSGAQVTVGWDSLIIEKDGLTIEFSNVSELP